MKDDVFTSHKHVHVLSVALIACSGVQIETGDKLFNFHLVRNWSPSREDHIKISQSTKFDVLSLDCNRVGGFEKLERLETMYGFGGTLSQRRGGGGGGGGHHLRIIIVLAQIHWHFYMWAGLESLQETLLQYFICSFVLRFVIKTEVLPIIIGFYGKQSTKRWVKHWSKVS